jgi:hypothetical protein
MANCPPLLGQMTHMPCPLQVSATTSTYSGGTASSNSLSLGDGRPTRTASSSVPSTTGLSISDRSMTHSSGQEVQLLVAEMQGLHKLLTTLLQVRRMYLHQPSA